MNECRSPSQPEKQLLPLNIFETHFGFGFLNSYAIKDSLRQVNGAAMAIRTHAHT